jgi:hypothetical protein
MACDCEEELNSIKKILKEILERVKELQKDVRELPDQLERR